ncbi:MAG: insulinase family protein [Oscillospiraceae bacterium]|jgi:predicted Zn-dependent peptidase|nr:insulinase family protein [Oscillospiraceae bacterium]MCI8716525.1 insulinase family protein [Oscillospiraceae bacterium]
MTRQTLLENVYLTHMPSEKFKTSFLSAQMAVPLLAETAGLNALLVNVLSRGTARLPDMAALGRELDLLYGAQLEPAVRKMGENQLFGFMASCIDDRFLPGGERLLEPLTELLGDMFCRPAVQDGGLNGDYVDSERENLVDLIRSDINDKRLYAARRLMETMCAGEPYGVGRMGRAGDVERITRQELSGHYRSVLSRGRLELFYCGSAPEDRVADAFRRAFAGLPRQGLLEPTVTTRRAAPASCRVVEEAMDVTQGKLCMGFRTDSGDVPATMLMNAMFGGEVTSKLFLNVREKLSLCYYVSSSFHRRKGLITVYSGIEFENCDRAVAEISAQLEDLKNGRWEDWELQGARSSLISSLRSTEDSAGAIESFVMGQAAAGGSETIPGLLEEVRAVTPDRIREAAAAVKPDTIYFLKGKEAIA